MIGYKLSPGRLSAQGACARARRFRVFLGGGGGNFFKMVFLTCNCVAARPLAKKTEVKHESSAFSQNWSHHEVPQKNRSGPRTSPQLMWAKGWRNMKAVVTPYPLSLGRLLNEIGQCQSRVMNELYHVASAKSLPELGCKIDARQACCKFHPISLQPRVVNDSPDFWPAKNT